MDWSESRGPMEPTSDTAFEPVPFMRSLPASEEGMTLNHAALLLAYSTRRRIREFECGL